jgi:hypothetical protein
MIILYIIICILTFFIGFLLGRKNNITIHNEDDIKKGMELERRNKKFKDYLNSYYYDTIPPKGKVEEGYRKIRKEVLGHY